MATRIIWHGYLLTSTGSNLYTSNIARTWAQDGHTVIVLCQDDRIAQLPECIGHAVASGQGIEWVSEPPEPDAAGCILVNPDIAGLLPVYVVDRYAGFEVKRMVDLSDAERDRYLDRNREAMAAVLDRWPAAEAALVNHVVLGPEAVRPALEAAGVPMVVKVHGSELEYALAEDASLVPFAQSGLAGADRILAGSRHIVRRTEELVGAEVLGSRVQVVPPGVDMELFSAERYGSTRAERMRGLVAHVRAHSAGSQGAGRASNMRAYEAAAGVADPVDLRAQLTAHTATYEEREIDVDAAAGLETVCGSEAGPIVAYVGKLISQKGPQLAVMAAPLIRAAHPDVRFVVAGFGPLRDALGALAESLSRGDLEAARAVASAGAGLDGGTGPWTHAESLLETLDAEGRLGAYLTAAAGIADDIAWLGSVGHDELARLWSVVDVTLVPSIFPEAFGMVAAEAAAAGALPVVARHTGLGEVAAEIERATGLVHGVEVHEPGAVRGLAAATSDLLGLGEAAAATARAEARECVQQLWSWQAVAEETLAGLSAPA